VPPKKPTPEAPAYLGDLGPLYIEYCGVIASTTEDPVPNNPTVNLFGRDIDPADASKPSLYTERTRTLQEEPHRFVVKGALCNFFERVRDYEDKRTGSHRKSDTVDFQKEAERIAQIREDRRRGAWMVNDMGYYWAGELILFATGERVEVDPPARKK